MRTLLHLRIKPDSKPAFVAAVAGKFPVLDAKDVDNVHGEPMVLLTVVAAEGESWELPLTQLFHRLGDLVTDRDNRYSAAVILDGVDFDALDGLSFNHDLLQYLGKRAINLQVFPGRLTADDFG